MARTIEKGDKILDVRDVTRLFSDMESERDDLVQAVEDAKEARDAFASDDSDDAGEIDAAETELADAEKELAEWDADNGEDFKELKAFYDDLPSNGTLIHEDYFTEYAQQFADDIGAIDRNAGWPLNYIDWDAAADALRQDYTAYEWGDETYYCNE